MTTKPAFPYRLAGIEAEDRRLSADDRRRKRIQAARERVARIVPAEKIDVAAMSLILLEEERGAGNVSRSMLLERIGWAYPDSSIQQKETP